MPRSKNVEGSEFVVAQKEYMLNKNIGISRHGSRYLIKSLFIYIFPITANNMHPFFVSWFKAALEGLSRAKT